MSVLVLAIAAGFASSLLAAEYLGYGTAIALRIVWLASLLLPKECRQRYREEWSRHVIDVSERKARVLTATLWALSTVVAAVRLAQPRRRSIRWYQRQGVAGLGLGVGSVFGVLVGIALGLSSGVAAWLLMGPLAGALVGLSSMTVASLASGLHAGVSLTRLFSGDGSGRSWDRTAWLYRTLLGQQLQPYSGVIVRFATTGLEFEMLGGLTHELDRRMLGSLNISLGRGLKLGWRAGKQRATHQLRAMTRR